MKKKGLALALALVLVVACAVGGTLAWLTARTDEVKNTFSTSDVGVELTETRREYKMVPGWTIDKDPVAKVTSGSEDCYLFVKVEKSSNFDGYMDFAIDSKWTLVPGTENVYYIEIDRADEKDVSYNILGAGKKTYDGVEYTWTQNQVLVKPTVTKDMMQKAETDEPTLTFTAYAVQLYKSNSAENNEENKFTPVEAWDLAKDLPAANP